MIYTDETGVWFNKHACTMNGAKLQLKKSMTQVQKAEIQ
jgi:hypothetical protein